jgi:hypothetical protein
MDAWRLFVPYLLSTSALAIWQQLNKRLCNFRIVEELSDWKLASIIYR